MQDAYIHGFINVILFGFVNGGFLSLSLSFFYVYLYRQKVNYNTTVVNILCSSLVADDDSINYYWQYFFLHTYFIFPPLGGFIPPFLFLGGGGRGTGRLLPDSSQHCISLCDELMSFNPECAKGFSAWFFLNLFF